MSTPEDAVGTAREAAARMRAEGAYADAPPIRVGPPPPEAAARKLYQWALIEPDISDVRSTRRYGAPITALKRGLLRLLGQYHMVLTGDQTRFNVTLLDYVKRLEARIVELEARLQERSE